MYHIVMQDRSLPIDPQLTEEQQAEQQVKFQSFLAELKQSLYDQVKEKYDNQAVVLSYQLYDAWFHPLPLPPCSFTHSRAYANHFKFC